MEFSAHDQEKSMCNFEGSWFEASKFMKGVTQLYGVSKAEALFWVEFPRAKVRNLKNFLK